MPWTRRSIRRAVNLSSTFAITSTVNRLSGGSNRKLLRSISPAMTAIVNLLRLGLVGYRRNALLRGRGHPRMAIRAALATAFILAGLAALSIATAFLGPANQG